MINQTYKELDVVLKVKVHAMVIDLEATDQTIRFMIEEDLRDKCWDADVEVLKEE